MSVTGTVNLETEVSGLGTTVNLPIEFTLATAPEEVIGPSYAVIKNSATDLDLGTIDPGDVLGVLIIARSDTIGIVIDTADDNSVPSTTGDNIVLDGSNNEAVYLNFASGLNSNGNIRIIGDAATAAIEYLVIGKQS